MDKRLALVAAGALAALLTGTAWMAFRPGVAGPCPGSGIAGAAIGGPFTLVDETGATVTDAEVIDRPSLIYFGYTFCPDVCPFDAARNAEAVDLLAARGHDVKPVFISVDPKRDTPGIVGEFTDFLHDEMLGLTGSPSQGAGRGGGLQGVLPEPRRGRPGILLRRPYIAELSGDAPGRCDRLLSQRAGCRKCRRRGCRGDG